MDITIIGWVWLGILVGTILGFMLCSWLTQSKISDLESEIVHHIFVRDSLKEEIIKLDNQPKPKPRKQFVDKDTFDSLYKVLSKQEYNLNQEAFERKPSSEQIQWWKDEETYLDADAPITQSNHE